MVTSFIEKPKSDFESWASEVSDEMKAEGRVYLAIMGIYIFNRKTAVRFAWKVTTVPILVKRLSRNLSLIIR
jgi:hypothetical protein